MKQILVSLNMTYSFARDIWRGIVRYAFEHGRWGLWPVEVDGLPDGVLKNYHGTIGMFATPEKGQRVQRHQKAVVNVSNRGTGSQLPSVLNDDAGVGRMAANYFLSKGFRHFAFYGTESLKYSLLRQEGYQTALSEAGFQVEVTQPHGHTALRQWLPRLAPATAIFCSNDNEAFSVIRACWELNIPVPQQLAVLGVDNDETFCQGGTIGLSSVMLASEKLGYLAAQLLDQLLNGEPAPKGALLIPPLNVVSRISTDIQAVNDDLVRKALQYIRDHVRDGFQVDDLLRHLAVGRRTLERKFQEHLGCSPHHEITRVRIELAKQLLQATQMKMEDIAQRCGFSEARILYRNFRAFTGQSPAQYRKDCNRG